MVNGKRASATRFAGDVLGPSGGGRNDVIAEDGDCPKTAVSIGHGAYDGR